MLRPPPASRWRGPSGRVERILRNPMTVPVLLAVIMFSIGAQVALMYKIPSPGNDEPAHLGYIGALARGELPTIDSPMVEPPSQFGDLTDPLRGWDEAHRDIWVANHPPLFHLLLVPIFNMSDGDPRSVFIALRLVNTIGFALWIVLVGAVARALVPTRAAVPAMAALAALTPTLTMRSGFLMNDGLSASASLLVILMTIRMLRGSPTRIHVGLCVAGGVVAAGTRASGVLTVAVCAVTLVIVLGRREGWARAAGVFALVAGIPAAVTGWFFIRNYRLYGDFTGQDALLFKFERAGVDSLREFWQVPGLGEAFRTTPVMIGLLITIVPWLAWRHRRCWRRVDPAWVPLTVLTVLTVANVVMFLIAGGGYHDRYLMPIMPLPATLIALAVLDVFRVRDGGDSTRRDWLVAFWWALGCLAWLTAMLIWLEKRYIFSLQDHFPVGTAVVPIVLVGTASAAGLGGLGVLAANYRRLGGSAKSGGTPPPNRGIQSAEPAL